MIGDRSESGQIAAASAPVQPLPTGRLVGTAALVAGGAAALVALARFGFSSHGLVAALFLGVLAVLAVIDYKHHLLPNKIVLPAAVLVLVLQVVLFPDRALELVLASLGTFAALLFLAMIRPGGLGMGDVKLGLLLGAGMGAQVFGAVATGAAAMWPVAIWLLVRHGSGALRKSLPFGPALAFSAAVVTLVGGV
jgi:leader peptidase (prepilin peptidase)/N-methyltransferase